jgi:hypothetical protein
MERIFMHQHRITFTMLSVLLAASLCTCGGGDDGRPPARVTISGTAAVGAAMINRAVAVVCKSGSGATITDDNGRFSVAIDDAAGPCLLSTTVGVTNGATLRSLAKGDGTVANITPLTELLTQYVVAQSGAGTTAGVPPSAIVANAKVGAVLGNTASLGNSVNRLTAAIKTAAGSGGATLAIPSDFLTASLVAKSATNTVGNEQDVILDTLRAKNLVTATGAPAPAVVTAVTADALANPVTGQ